MARVEQMPQLRPLVARIPLSEVITQADDALLGASLLLITTPAAEDPVEAPLRDRVEQGPRLERIAGAVAALVQAPVVDPVLHLLDDQSQTQPLDFGIAIGEHLGEVVPGVDMQHGEGDRRRPEGLDREVEHDDGVLAPAEEQDRAFEFADDLADDVDRLAFQHVELRERCMPCAGFRVRPPVCLGDRQGGGRVDGQSHVWIPHSVLVSPAHRPDRGSAPGATGRVHGSQPMEG